MAGVMMEGDEGREVQYGSQPAQGGSEYRQKIGMDDAMTAKTVVSEHMDGFRAEGVSYNENPGMDVTTRAYPEGTRMSDSTPGDDVN